MPWDSPTTQGKRGREPSGGTDRLPRYGTYTHTQPCHTRDAEKGEASAPERGRRHATQGAGENHPRERATRRTPQEVSSKNAWRAPEEGPPKEGEEGGEREGGGGGGEVGGNNRGEGRADQPQEARRKGRFSGGERRSTQDERKGPRLMTSHQSQERATQEGEGEGGREGRRRGGGQTEHLTSHPIFLRPSALASPCGVRTIMADKDSPSKSVPYV